MLTVAIAARKDSLKALRSRIAEILAPIPVGVVLSDEAGEVCERKLSAAFPPDEQQAREEEREESAREDAEQNETGAMRCPPRE
jgi:hypothetical protein